MTSFAHIADVHLGHKQYGLDQREEDVRDSFEDAVDRIIEKNVDFVLLAGDLFHSRDVDAETLNVAENQLTRLKDEGIKVMAVEGNHDARLYRKELSWMEYLHKKGLLTLLEADFDDEKTFKPPALNSDETPGYVDYNGVRVFGVQYLGQRFNERISEIIEGIREVNVGDDPDSTILISHFGVSGLIPGTPGVDEERAEELSEAADYLALGHFHKCYELGSIHNPGSLEAHSRRQGKWERGFYFVDQTPGGLVVRHEKSKRRPYRYFSLDVEGSYTPSELKSDFRTLISEEDSNLSGAPIITLRLEGALNFSREEFDVGWFEEQMKREFDALHVIVSDLTEATAVSPLEGIEEDDLRTEDGQVDRDKLENAVFRNISSEDSRYGEKSDEVAKAMSVTKRMLLLGEDPSAVANELKAKRRSLFSDNLEGEKS